ncbi:hypothetical protein K3495_g2658 [Podosphaera aphanis]|nr:hypothetical protein K3495_g2658 [Podosphaera aphanis]
MKHWKRTVNQFDSAKLLLLEKNQDFDQQLEPSVDNICDLAISINASISSLAQQTEGLVLESDLESYLDSESEGEPEEGLIDRLVEMDDEPTPSYDALAFASEMHHLVDLFVERHSIGDTEFVERLIRQNASSLTLLDEIYQRNRMHLQATTWGKYKNPLTLFYKKIW